MNIVVRTISGNCIVRPDTTWERDNEDIFPPEFVDRLSFVPVLFARISKPGKSIGLRFASRYYDSLNYGILLYPENLMNGGEEDYACASCIDHTSFLSSPLFDKTSFSSGMNEFRLYKGEEEIYHTDTQGIESIETAISESSSRIYLRTGDLVAVELSGRLPLWNKGDNDNPEIHGTFSGKDIIDFKIR